MVTIECIDDLECCGCSACYNACPKNAISMEENQEGFLIPVINKEKCVNCGLCLKICPMKNNEKKIPDGYPIALAAKNKNKSILLSSSSGGVFYELANYILSNNGIVYGAAYNKDLTVEHTRIESIKDIKLLQGSKYVQSNINNSYKNVKKDLENGLLVLFSGTPCQIKGLKNYLIKEYDNLLTCDLVCHGVPSQKLFKKYILYLEDKYKKKVIKYDFRNKEKKGWGLNSKITFYDNTFKFINSDFDPYYDNFLNCNIYRESCYNCKFCNIKRCSDITLADYWGVLSIHNTFYDENGVSLILINSNKGLNIFDKLRNIISIKTDLEYAKQKNKNLVESSHRNSIRDSIYLGMDSEKYIVNKLRYKKTPKKILKLFVSNKFKKKIKRIKIK